MKQVSFEEIGAVVATFTCGEDVEMGQVVKVSGNDTVSLCDAGDSFCGVAMSTQTEESAVGVQVAGFCTVPISGSVAVGYVLLAGDGAGGVKTVSTGGRSYLVVSVDSTAGTAVICL